MTIAVTAAAQRANWISPVSVKALKSIFHLHNSQLVGSASRIHIPELRSGDVSSRLRLHKRCKGCRVGNLLSGTCLTSSNRSQASDCNDHQLAVGHGESSRIMMWKR